MKFNETIGFTVGGFTVGHKATMNGSKAVGTIAGISEDTGRMRILLAFPEPQPGDGPEGATATRFELDWRNISSTWREAA